MASFSGTSSDDSLPGTGSADDFDMSQGGDDTVAAGDGNDRVYMGATLTAADSIDGGAGIDDLLELSGNYATKLVLAAGTMTGFENLQLDAGGAYNLVLDDGNVAAGAQLSVDAGALGVADVLRLDAGHETDGQFVVNFGLGRAKVVLGAGDDTFNFFTGVLNAADRINGAAGSDRVILSGTNQTDYVFGSHTMRNVELLQIANAFDFDITFADATIAKHALFVIDASLGSSLAFHDAVETNGAISMTATVGADAIELGAGNDTVFAGGGADTVSGGGGGDSLVGSDGTDVLTGGAGADMLIGGLDADTFVFTATADSTRAASDTIQDLEAADIIDLSAIDANLNKAGDQAFKLVGHFSGHAGEMVLKFVSAESITLLQADVDGDGQADFAVTLEGDQRGFSHFVL